ncbi:MAG: polyamine aminopropyltransferase [Erysipelotrichaceae bacterium]|nr:polyamine aminopropyltransferase [Erysipelotrichaceae bacterium]MCD8574648.1 polyamine aminopropyltransferase [Erysipelotrichaceae bacterium]
MELWYTEQQTEHVRFSIKIKQHLFSSHSGFQQVDVFDSVEFGKFLTLDGLMMVTEKDEFIYHDMIVHVPMATNPNIKKVLVIGAGDGGTVRELLRYPHLETIDMVEIDKMVVDVSVEFLPQTASQLYDEKVNLYFEDGLKFVRSKVNEYDLIIVDSTDPFGPGEGLFTKEFYSNCYRALKAEGILVNQHESPYYPAFERNMRRAHQRISEIFEVAQVYQAHIPTYPSGHWLFGYASKGIQPINEHVNTWKDYGLKTKYYNPALHIGCFALPTYVIESLKEEYHD